MKNVKEMIDILFTTAKEETQETVANIMGNELSAFGLKSNLEVGHFLAQFREEVGPDLEPKNENLNYKSTVLPKLFKIFRENPELAEQYGRNDEHKANQEMIANYAYSNRIGNGDVESGDGWKFRGRGYLQLTGRSNYTEVQKRIDKYAPNSGIDILDGESIGTVRGAIYSAAGFIVWKDLYKQARLGIGEDAVNAVTAVINKHTDSYEKRLAHFNAIKHLIDV